jgi:hypothetical protein
MPISLYSALFKEYRSIGTKEPMKQIQNPEMGRQYKYRFLYSPKVMTKMEVVELDDELDKEFRKTIVEVKGLRKGVIKESFTEAVKAWIKEQKRLKREAKNLG